ncbi:MAG: CDP-alcohol phosphatidyltransferase family protein, partial [Rhodospirillales bacterium]|nr:CDP-alcohol phosphatidyltransferase family protein [Rhodospirillales bacterium]
GFIAKRFNAETVIGAFLDPLADKALLVSVYLTLGYQEILPSWLVILVVFRDLLIVGGAILFETLTHSLEMDPLKISKINTFAQIVLAATVLFSLSHDYPGAAFVEGMAYVVAVTTVASGAAYVFKWGKRAIFMEGEDR